jgi:hypothetical protein
LYRVLVHEGKEQLRPTFSWFKPKRTSGPIESRLAGIYFPLLGEHIAPCYSRIATDAILEQVLDHKNRAAIATFDGLTEEVARFLATTATIVIGLVSRLSSTEFKPVRHSTSLDLSSEMWLENISETINHGFSGFLRVEQAVFYWQQSTLAPSPTRTKRKRRGQTGSLAGEMGCTACFPHCYSR